MKQHIEEVVVYIYNPEPDSKNHYKVRVQGTYNIVTAWCGMDNLHETVAGLMLEIEERVE